MNRSSPTGFTLIEILIVVVILGGILSTTIISLSKFHRAQVLRTTSEEIISLLNDARSRTFSSENSSQYGVHVTSSDATLYIGPTYTSGTSTNKVTTIDSLVSISSISLNGGVSDVLFNRLSGDTNGYGTITLQLVSDATKQKVITILKTGTVSVN